jgi:hypothetical protein
MVLVGGVSILLVLEDTAWRLAGGLLILTGALVVLRLRTCRQPGA